MTEENLLFASEAQMDLSLENGQPEVQIDKYLLFISDQLRFGVVAEDVVEIITSHIVTKLPMVPLFVKGIINLRGQIIPIIDIRLRLNKPERENDCIIVITVEGVQVGVLVDGVDQMVDIPRGDLSPVPAQNSQELVSGMCSLPDGSTMLVLDCPQLIHI